MNLSQLGWCEHFEGNYQVSADESFQPARVTRRNRNDYQVHGEHGALQAELAGRILYDAGARDELPAIGDWVVVQEFLEENKAIIHALLPNKSRFSRRAVTAGGRADQGGELHQQVVAANVDIAFLVSGLDGGRNFNLSRIERYLTLTRDGGATPVIVLNKADVCEKPEDFVVAVDAMALGIPAHLVSAVRGDGLDELAGYLPTGRTGVFLGPSGVGKSSLINSLLGTDQLPTQHSRGDDRRGRHTTTRSEVLFLPGRGMVIDTPGMRDVQLWASEESVQQTFSDIEELAQQCQFRNCAHQREKGCAILAALGNGVLDGKRYESYLKQKREAGYVARQLDRQTARIDKQRQKKFSRALKDYQKSKKEDDSI